MLTHPNLLWYNDILQHVRVKLKFFQILMTTSSFFLLTSVFFLIFSTVPGFQNATRDMFGVRWQINFSVVLNRLSRKAPMTRMLKKHFF